MRDLLGFILLDMNTCIYKELEKLKEQNSLSLKKSKDGSKLLLI